MANKKLRLEDFESHHPDPLTDYPRILLAHGGGGRLTRTLAESVFAPAFHNAMLNQLHDGAIFRLGNLDVAFTTDSCVVHPLFFPGGDIGRLAVFGTVNDLAMCGAQAIFLSAGFVIEEGLPTETLWGIVQSMRHAAGMAGVKIVTGDTKVVEQGHGDGVFINTAGVGVVEPDRRVTPDQVRIGDAVLLSGDVGRHGTAIMAAREGVELEGGIESDSAPLDAVVAELFEAGVDVHCLRDATCGGVASALVEVAESAGAAIDFDEALVPVRENVRAACEVFGLDPLYVANEGRFVAFVDESSVDCALDAMQAHDVSGEACVIGRVVGGRPGAVTMRTAAGGSRVIELQSGEQLTRIR